MSSCIKTSEGDRLKVFNLKKQGAKVADICTQLKLGKSTVYRVLAEFDPKSLHRGGYTKRASLSSFEREIRVLYEKGVGSPTIAKVLNLQVNHKTILSLLESIGVETRARVYPYAKQHSNQIVELYSEGMGSTTIGRLIGVSQACVVRVLRQCNVAIRPKKRPSLRSVRERDRLFVQHQKHIESRAKWYAYKYRDLGFDRSEFLQLAYIAALRAAELWKAEEGTTFKTYVSVCIHKSIKGFVSREIRNCHAEFDEQRDSRFA